MANQDSGRSDVPAKTPGTEKAHVAALRELDRLERVLEGYEWPERRAFVRARKRARERAVEMLEGGDAGTDATRVALFVAAAELLGAMRVELAGSSRDAARLAQQLEDIVGVSRSALGRDLLTAPELLTMPATVAIEVQLAMLTAFAQLRSASLWTLDDLEQVNCLRHVGEGSPSRGTKQLAQRLLSGEDSEQSARSLRIALPVGRWRQPLAALVASVRPGMRDASRSLLRDAVPMLGAILEHDALLAGNAASEQALVESSERKLTRLGFDLHDGPMQNVAALAQDLRLFASQLEGMPATEAQKQLLAGRMEDFEAQLVAVDGELRRLARDVHAPVLLNRPFSRAIRDVIQSFAARTNIEPGLRLHGEMTQLSASQQTALLNIVHESLTNIREHSGATEVDVVVSVDANGVEAQITDNGRGFDVEMTLLRAAQKGRVGLVAMHERVRLLGGQYRIESRPGGPTTVFVALERWQPLVHEALSARVLA